MSRTLGDDFDEDDLPGGSIDLEKGSQTGAGGSGGASTSYDGGGMEFDDDPYGEGVPGADLELDLPQGSAAALRTGAPAPAPAPAPHTAGPAVPDLVLGPAPAPRTSGAQAAAGAAPAVRPEFSIPSVVPSSQRMLGAERAREDAALRAPPPSSSGALPAAPSSGSLPATAPEPPRPPPRPTGASVIAKYPEAPPHVWQAPKYAIQILLRQFELRSDLESLRRRRSPDVPLYESALRAYDAKTFRLGMAINVAVLSIATFVFFLPVILRFMRAD